MTSKKYLYLELKIYLLPMSASQDLINGVHCHVIAGTHKGKSGMIADLHHSKTGHLTLTVIQENGVRFKTFGKNVQLIAT